MTEMSKTHKSVGTILAISRVEPNDFDHERKMDEAVGTLEVMGWKVEEIKFDGHRGSRPAFDFEAGENMVEPINPISLADGVMDAARRLRDEWDGGGYRYDLLDNAREVVKAIQAYDEGIKRLAGILAGGEGDG